MTQLSFDLPASQRWRARRASYRPAGEPIDPRRYGVEVIEQPRAKGFVLEHHYSGTFPAARCSVGLFRSRDFAAPELVGVAIFSVPCNVATTQKHLSLGCDAGVELGRFVLVDDVPANGESWFLARAFRALLQEKPEIRGVVSYSDPFPRTSVAGDVVMPGHYGCCYQAANARYLGRGRADTLLLAADGRVVSKRALSKLRTDDRGAGYAYRQLLQAGAPPRHALEDLSAYVDRALREGPFRRLRHPGNHVYAWRFDANITAFPDPPLPYPKHPPALSALAS